jgi:hypothetical protein
MIPKKKHFKTTTMDAKDIELTVKQIDGDGHLATLKKFIQGVINYKFLTAEQKGILSNYYVTATLENAAQYHVEAQKLISNAQGSSPVKMYEFGSKWLTISGRVTVGSLILYLLLTKYEQSSLVNVYLVRIYNFVKYASGICAFVGLLGVIGCGSIMLGAE